MSVTYSNRYAHLGNRRSQEMDTPRTLGREHSIEGSDRETPNAITINRCWWKEAREANATPAVYAAKLQGHIAPTPRPRAKRYSP
jgi:hypothetical protein